MVSLGQDDHVTEKCAVLGVYNVGSEAARLTFYGLSALQHRGQESSGIVTSDSTLHSYLAPGLVATAYREKDLEMLPGAMAIGHNRYSTSGGADDAHGQPIVNMKQFALAHNGNFPITDMLESFLYSRGVSHIRLNDSEMMAEVIGCHIDDDTDLEQAILRAYPLLEGAFSVVAMDNQKLIAFRDPCGIRPLSIATLGEGYVVASETCAFDAIGAEFLRDIRPGEVVVIDERGVTSHQVVEGELKLDIFEFVYFARPDSVIEGRKVHEVRRNMGKELAKEWQIEADIVVPVPDSAIPAAVGYAEGSGLPLELALMKNSYIHRTFIRPSAQLREQDLRMKLNPIPGILPGKRVILIDDSIVRGTTMRRTAHMLYEAGAKEVHILISSPPVRYPDFYGINLPHQAALLAVQMKLKEIAAHLSVDSVGYLSIEGMVRATGLPAHSFSMACFDGVYPIKIGKRQEQIAMVTA